MTQSTYFLMISSQLNLQQVIIVRLLVFSSVRVNIHQHHSMKDIIYSYPQIKHRLRRLMIQHNIKILRKEIELLGCLLYNSLIKLFRKEILLGIPFLGGFLRMLRISIRILGIGIGSFWINWWKVTMLLHLLFRFRRSFIYIWSNWMQFVMSNGWIIWRISIKIYHNSHSQNYITDCFPYQPTRNWDKFSQFSKTNHSD